MKIKSAYTTFKNYILGSEGVSEENLFEKVKIELIFNLSLIFSIVYLLALVSVLLGKYWYILAVRIFGLVFFLLAFYVLKKTKHYLVPSKVITVSIVIFGILALIIGNGHLTYANLGFAIFNTALVMLLLNNTFKIAFFCYYVLFISYSLCVNYHIFPPLDIGIDFTHDQEYYKGNLLFPILPFLFLVYMLHSFITYEYRVKILLTGQIDAIQLQEEEIMKANESTHESMQIASKIQQAFLPDFSNKSDFYHDYFLLLKPKYELSGDFYWVAENHNSLFCAVVDSSENNVMGAIVGSIYFEALDTAVKEKHLTQVGEIISYVNAEIRSKTDMKNLKDTVKLSVLKIDKNDQKLFFTGERNSLYIAKKNKKVIDEYKPQLIYSNGTAVSYSEVQIEFEEGDVVYLSTDGFASSYQGFSNHKFKESVFKTFLLSIKSEPLDVQKRLLEDKLKSWVGKGVQPDDVCMIAFAL